MNAGSGTGVRATRARGGSGVKFGVKFLQLSDLHLTGDTQPLFGSSPRARLDAAIDSIVREHADAAFCLLTGDLADAGDARAYAELAAAIARLPMPAYALPGNHDDRQTLARTLPDAKIDASGFLQRAVDTACGRFLLLDTLVPGHPWGEYCEQRRAWLRDQLDDASVAHFWIVMHHPPLAVGIRSMDQYALREPEAFRALLAPHRHKIRHLFFGHLHRAIGGSWHGLPFSCVRSPNHQVALDLHTFPEVPGCQEAPGYGVVLIDKDSVVVHHHDFIARGERYWL
jgi:3',5'-cyclic AMP phosphodiesterase CpdA